MSVTFLLDSLLPIMNIFNDYHGLKYTNLFRTKTIDHYAVLKRRGKRCPKLSKERGRGVGGFRAKLLDSHES